MKNTTSKIEAIKKYEATIKRIFDSMLTQNFSPKNQYENEIYTHLLTQLRLMNEKKVGSIIFDFPKYHRMMLIQIQKNGKVIYSIGSSKQIIAAFEHLYKPCDKVVEVCVA